MRPSRTIRVAAAQTPPCGNDAAANQARALRAVAQAADAGAGFIVLPELATLPYFCGAPPGEYAEWAEPTDGALIKSFAEAAAQHRVVIILPFYEFDTETATFHNAIVAVGPNGMLMARDRDGQMRGTTRKLHLPAGPDGDERGHFVAGERIGVYEHEGIVFGALVCYDRRFPECWRELRSLGASVVFVAVAGEGGDPVDFFTCELRTHARENGVVVVAANKTGTESATGRTVRNFGASCVITAAGDVAAQRADDDGPGVVLADIDLADVADVRMRFPYFEDRRHDVGCAATVAGARAAASQHVDGCA